jgi:mono/diheme cytochrome c family protein
VKKTTYKNWAHWPLALTALSILSLSTEAVADVSCDNGFLVANGQRCVQWNHIEMIQREPQPTDPGNYFFNFDKSYENMGELLTDQPMVEADAALGGFYMYNGNYVRLGVSYPSFVAAAGRVKNAERPPYRDDPRQRKLPYNLNAVKAPRADLAAPNCTVCHSSVVQGKLVQGLGRFNHFIGTDASGFTLNVPGIGVASIFRGDTLDQIRHGIPLITRLFRDASLHSHLFDVFAGLGMRHDQDTLEWKGRINRLQGHNPNSGMKGWIDFPAWWLMTKKNALYQAGTGRGAMADHLLYMSWFSVDGIEEAEQIQNNFAHVQKWMEEEIEVPKYEDFGPRIDYNLASTGEPVFLRNCAACHGTYSENDEEETYPNFLVDLEEIGTDPYLANKNWIYPVKTWWDGSWYGKRGTSSIERTHGYVAPPLDGVFITAPYFHNGSVPTLEAVLDSSKRPTVWTSNYKDNDYDWQSVGWKNKPLDWRPNFEVKPLTGIGIGRGRYDTRKRGNSNDGHTYGDQLTADERRAVLEYLKTL